MVAGFLHVNFVKSYGAKGLIRPHCAVGNDLSDQLVIRGITRRPLSIELQSGLLAGLKDKKSWSEPDLSALRCEKVWFKVVGGQL